MTPTALLAALHDLGAEAYRVGDKIRLRPAAVLNPEILAQVKAAKAELLPLLPDKPAEPPVGASGFANATIWTAPSTVIGTPTDAPAITWAETYLTPDVVATLGALGRRCESLAAGTDEAAYHGAVEQLVGYLGTIREVYEATHRIEETAEHQAPGPWRLVVGRMDLRPSPVVLDRARTVHNVPAFVESTLAELERAITLRNSGRSTYLTDVVDERVEHLRLCGVDVTAEVVQRTSRHQPSGPTPRRARAASRRGHRSGGA